MTAEEIAAAWAVLGDMARASSFRLDRDLENGMLHVMADLAKTGSGATVTTRVVRSLPLASPGGDILAALGWLYGDLIKAVGLADTIGGKFE